MHQFVRVEQSNGVIPALVSDTGLLDLRSLISDITPDTIASGILTKVNTATVKPLTVEGRYLAPIQGIHQIPATGFNYKKHIEEMKVPVPTEPEVFLKSTLSLTGPFDPIRRGPNAGVKLDWETELAIVIGREVQDIEPDEAADYIFGYVCLNDISVVQLN
jgi:2,4-diketo-3-deoxy-L-fuconate hydrolase